MFASRFAQQTLFKKKLRVERMRLCYALLNISSHLEGGKINGPATEALLCSTSVQQAGGEKRDLLPMHSFVPLCRVEERAQWSDKEREGEISLPLAPPAAAVLASQPGGWTRRRENHHCPLHWRSCRWARRAV